jgi:signal transduction histidine kinase
LIAAIAEIAAASLRRALVLEALEKKVSVRNRQLSTLYNLNAIANEPFPLETILERLLAITLEAMGCQTGAIHLLDQPGESLHLAAQQNLPSKVLPRYENLRLRKGFWKELVSTSNPLFLPDLRLEERLPAELRSNPIPGKSAYLGTPIRAKGQPLGLLSLFAETIQDYSLEDITLFMTIADQIGISVERARLIRQSELAAVVEERQRLARELHDSVTQLLYSQVLFAGASLKSLELGKIDLLEQHLQRLDQAALQALKEMRLLVYELRPADYLESGLAAALHNRLEAVEKRTGMSASLAIDGDADLDETIEMAFYRIAQEALNNTLKHSGAKSVSIHLYRHPERISLEISDDGCGFDLEEGGLVGSLAGGLGLTSMLERAAEIGADLEIRTAPGCGTHITVTLQEEP